METAPEFAASLIQVSVLVGMVLLVQAFAVRRLPVDSIPQVLRGRVALSNRVRPWLLAGAALMALAGAIIHLG